MIDLKEYKYHSFVRFAVAAYFSKYSLSSWGNNLDPINK